MASRTPEAAVVIADEQDHSNTSRNRACNGLVEQAHGRVRCRPTDVADALASLRCHRQSRSTPSRACRMAQDLCVARRCQQPFLECMPAAHVAPMTRSRSPAGSASRAASKLRCAAQLVLEHNADVRTRCQRRFQNWGEREQLDPVRDPVSRVRAQDRLGCFQKTSCGFRTPSKSRWRIIVAPGCAELFQNGLREEPARWN